jgi:subtilisin family serine protease
MKKHILLSMLFAMVSTIATAQIFNPHKRALNRAEEKAADLLKGGADFVLDPIEQVPSERTGRNVSPMSQTNWGATLLLTPALRERLVNECTFKVLVKIADTGHPDHAALRQGQLPGKNYTTDADMGDGNGHSTHVAGIIASDQLGVCDALVDKGLLKHKAVKILSNQGSGSFDWVRVAVAAERAEDQAALSRGEFVVWNGSFGGGTGLVQSVETELQKSTDAGVVFLFAAGNTGGAGVNYPGNGKYSIACASLDQSLLRSSYSTQGPEVWAAMPGRNINSTYKGQTWATLSGTSMATPFLTAAVAIAYSKWGPKMGKVERVRAYIAWCSKDIIPAGKDTDTGWGLTLIQNILDRDPTNTPGLPNDPPPPPPPPGDGLKSITPLPVVLKGTFNVMWDNLAPSATSGEAKTFKTAGRGSRSANQGLALKTAKVQFEITAPSTESAGVTAQKLETAVSNYFKNRGFLILPTQDESWAAYWAAYFLEMGLQTGPLKWPINVNRVILETAQGQKVPISNLRHFPK